MATATLISYPSALCLAGNISPVMVSAAGLFTFRLKKGSTVLLEEDYVPDASGQAEIDIRDLVLSDLSLSLPSADVFKQTAAAASYTISTDTDSRTFKAVLGGIDRPATDAATFLGANFLTWQPQLKSVTYGQPEWLSFYTPATAVSLKAKFYLKDGTTSTVTVAASFDPGCVYSVNVRFSRLWGMGEGDRYGMVDVWLEDDQSTALTYVQRYVLDTSGDERTVLVARNSLGGIDTFSFLGSMERSAEAEHTNVMRGETMFSGLVDMTRTYTVNTGILSGHGRDWVWDLQRSPQAWVLMDGALRGIVMLAPAVTASMYEDSTGTVDFLLCDDSGYLNMPRLESLPENIEVPGPDGEVFFLAPRLADYPDASLDDSLLLPVQSPAAQEWSKLSVAALSSYILSAVDDKYGEFLHVHENLPVLGKLSVDDNGRLMYDGSPVGGSGLTEHDHHGETIRPEKIVVGTVEITCVDGRLHVSSTITSDGDFVAFGDEEGSTGSGGLDVARLWEELEAPGTKQIDVSHIPDIELSKISDLHTSWDSVLASQKPAWLTAVSLSTISDLHASWDDMLKAQKPTTLAGYGIKDAYTKAEIDGELEKYVTLADNQNITGIKTFVNGIKIGSISLSVVDGRLHVSSTITSDGDFVAFGDEDGASGSGGLDVVRLWQELEADDSSKVIDVSHIPSITKAKISDFPSKWAWADISGKPSTFAPSAHSHAISDVTGLQNALDSKWVWSESQVKAVKVNSAGSADNADTLDNIHANELLTALTSNETTNLSLTVGGKSLSVTSLYAKYADRLSTAQKINGTPFDGTYDITTEKWGVARNLRIGDYYGNNGTSVGIDGSSTSGYVLPLPQSIKVKTLDVDGVTLSVVDGRLHISATATSAGDFVAYGDDEGGTGVLDVDKLWDELRADDSSKVIDISHIPSIPTSKITGLDNALASYATRTWVQQTFLTSVPAATSSVLGGIKVGYTEISGDKYYAVRLNSSNHAYVYVPWVNTTYSLSSFGISATAEEINKLDGIGTLLHSGNYTSYTVTKTGGGASGTWPISISGNAATADVSNYLSLNPNNGTHANQNDAVPANGRFAIYDVNMATTAGGSDGYIMAFRWPSGNWVTQLYLDVDNTGIMALRHRGNDSVWTDWYRILHSGNIGSYALTKSNYASTLDSRYVNVSGDTMTGTLNISSSSEALIRYQISGSNKAATGYLASQGAYLYSWPAGKYLHITDAGSLLFGSSTVWHSGNDGSGSGLDADLLDGYHSASLRYLSIYNPSSSGVLVRTDISSSANVMFSVHIWGNTYMSTARPIDSRLQFYNYEVSDAILEYSLQNNGYAISSVKVFCYNGYVYIWLPYIRTYMSYSVYVNTTNTDRDCNQAVEISSGGVPSGATRVVTVTPKNVALTTDNVASATKLQTARTLWGRPFDGTGNVSGAISSTGNITPSAAGAYNIGTASLWYEHIYGRYIDTASGYNLRLCTGGVERLSIDSSSGNVGIGTTSPAYKLDVAGEIRATSGITIGSTDDYGWYIYSSRICAGVGVARGVNAGSLLVSSAWADYTKVPTNGIYSKGDIITGGRLFIPSSEGNDKYYIRIE